MTHFSEPTYLSLPATFYSEQLPETVRQPEVLLWNEALANELGLTSFSSAEKAAFFSGNKQLEGSRPLAQAYAGHQFGHFTMLGDGRAILLTEVVTPSGKRFDIQLKGAGPTTYSRRGDGRATLKSMLREYLISEAMHFLRIPTSRSLAVVQSGEPVYREKVQPGAILTRVATSHIRVGTFEYARHFAEATDVKALLDYTIKRHDPELLETENPTLAFLEAVMHRQIELLVNWMRVGFIHGVMNTDNMGIAGETFDYGPCAFMNAYHPDTVFSSIDSQGRYAFANQPLIARWNLAALATTLLPLLGESEAEATNQAKKVLDNFMPKFQEHYHNMMGRKLGLSQVLPEDKHLFEGLLNWMQKAGADYTNTFLVLQGDLPESDPWQQPDFQEWKKQWIARCATEGANVEVMRSTNPFLIPRNHLVEEVLDHAHNGDMESFHEFLEELKRPYDVRVVASKYQTPPVDFDDSYQTFCGT